MSSQMAHQIHIGVEIRNSSGTDGIFCSLSLDPGSWKDQQFLSYPFHKHTF